MTCKQTYQTICSNIHHNQLHNIYDYFNTLSFRNNSKLIYYNTYLYKKDGYFEITYHGNKILTYRPYSLTFHNIYWYTHPSTSKRVNDLVLDTISISSNNKCLSGVDICLPLRKILMINPLGNVEYVSIDNTLYRYSYYVSQQTPLSEGTTIKASKIDPNYNIFSNLFEIESTTQWYKEKYKVWEDQELFKDIYKYLFEECIRREKSLWLYINTNTRDPNNVIARVYHDRKLPKLTEVCKEEVNKILDRTDLETNTDNVISLKIDYEALSNIDKTKELMKLYANA